MEYTQSIRDETLKLANNLRCSISSDASEYETQAKIRSSLSRAYYAAFYCARDLGYKCPESNFPGGVHKQLVDKMINLPIASMPSRKTSKDIRRIGHWATVNLCTNHCHDSKKKLRCERRT